VIEVGLRLWDVEAKQPVRLAGFLVIPDAPIAPEHWTEAEKIHGITRESVSAHGIAAGKALINILAWYRQADMVVAHNGAEFDRPGLSAPSGAGASGRRSSKSRAAFPLPFPPRRACALCYPESSGRKPGCRGEAFPQRPRDGRPRPRVCSTAAHPSASRSCACPARRSCSG
jgi:hypothetical protein